MPTWLPFVLSISGLVAVAAVSVFEVTRRNAEDSIGSVSRELSQQIIGRAHHSIEVEILGVVASHLSGMKYGVELGNYHLRLCAAQKTQNGIAHKNASSFAALDIYIDETTQEGCIVDTEGNSVAQLLPDNTLRVAKLDPRNGHFNHTSGFNVPIDIPGRPYYTILSDSVGVKAVQMDHPVWSPVFVSINPNIASPGLQVALTWPVLWGNGSLRGGVVSSAALRDLDLARYKLQHNSVVAMVETNHMLISSTTHSAPFYEHPPKSRAYVRYTLRSSGSQLLQKIGEMLPLPISQVMLQADVDAGEVYWVQTAWVLSYNLKWVILVAIPRERFFSKIDASNATTRIIVVCLVLSAIGMAVLLSAVFVYPLRRVAKAFDSLSEMHTDAVHVARIPRNSVFSEFNSLYNGFWDSIRMIENARTFLPVKQDNECTDEEEEEEGDISPLGHSMAESRSSQKERESSSTAAKNQFLGLGVRWHSSAVCVVLDVDDFECTVLQDRMGAQRTFEHFFTSAHLSAIHFSGRLAAVLGGKAAIAWMGACDQKEKAIRFSLSVRKHIVVNSGFSEVSMGVYIGRSFSGILGDNTSRHQVVGSTLLDGASAAAGMSRRLALPLVVANPILWNLPQAEAYHVSDVLCANYQTINTQGVSYVKAVDNLKDGEWMYQLQALNRKASTLQNAQLKAYFMMKSSGQMQEAEAELRRFAENLTSEEKTFWKTALSILQDPAWGVSTEAVSLAQPQPDSS